MPAQPADSAAFRMQFVFAGLWLLGLPLLLQIISSIYFYNLATTGLNPSAGIMAVFLLPWFATGLRRLSSRIPPLLLAILFAALAAAAVLWEPAPVVRVLLCAAGLFLLLMLLLRIRNFAGAAAGIIAGAAVSGLYLAAGDTYRPPLSVDGPAVLLFCAIWLYLFARSQDSLCESSGASERSGSWMAAAALGFWIFAQFSFFQFPGTIQAWTSLKLPQIAALLLGASVLVLWRPGAGWIGRIPSFVLFPAGIVAAMDLSHWQRIPAISLFVLLLLLFESWKALTASFDQKRERMALNFGLPSTIFMLLSFAWIFTVTYDQAKLLGSEFFRDRAPILFFLVTAIALGPLVIRPAAAAAGHRLTTVWMALAGLICFTILFRESPVPPAAPSGILRVATFNIYQGFDVNGYDNRRKLLAFVQSERPHLLGLQESDTSRPSSQNGNIVEWLARRSGAQSFFGPCPGLGSYGVSVVSTLPILARSVAPLLSAGEQAHLVWTRHRWGTRDITFLTTHFGLSDADHIRQMEGTIGLVRTLPGPKILAGDFNVDPRRNLDRRLLMQLASEAGLIDVLAPEGYDAPHASMAPTHVEGGRIDTIFVSREFRILQAHPLPGTNASDHFPVIADLQWR